MTMKRFFAFLFAALLVCVLTVPAFADTPQIDRSYTRFNDYAGTVTEEEEKELNDKVRPQIEPLQMDFPVCVYRTRTSETPLSEFAAGFYEDNRFGYGAEKSGILLVLDLGKKVFSVYYYGEADTLIDESAREAISDAFLADCRDDTVTYPQLYARYYDTVFAAVEDARLHPAPQAETPEDVSEDSEEAVLLDAPAKETPMPAWYPEDTDGFEDFHGEDLPPVVDDAHIFTDEQFETLSRKISQMTERLGIGYAAFTSDDNHGLMPEEYSSDFLHFNGYGVGEGYGAVVFYLSLDPEDRCWLTTSINTYEDLFTFDVTYVIDEMVDADIRGGDYYEAFIKHADYVDAMFTRMSEDLPAWYPEGTRTYALDRGERSLAPSPDLQKACIADDASVLSQADAKTFTQALRALTQQYGLDLRIFTDTVCRAPGKEDYADDYYYYTGGAADGICLYCFGMPGDDYRCGVRCYGSAQRFEKLKIESELRGKLKDGKADEAIGRYMELLPFMLEKGRLPMQIATRGFCLVVGVVAGLIAAAVITDKLKDAMRITTPESAQAYLTEGSFRLFEKSSSFLYSTVTRTAKPKDTGSGSSGSSSVSRGGSTHTSGRSAGGSYSSGGRRF